MGTLSIMNITVLLNDTVSTLGQSIPVVISNSRMMEERIEDFDTASIPTQGSDKPCSDAISSETPTSVKLPGSLDALLYIVIVLMFYAFSIVILMVKYIRREREEASLRSYYHEFVSREKFRSAQYKNRQFMKRIFSKHGSFDQPAIMSLEDETRCNDAAHKIDNQPEGNTFSRLLFDFEDDKRKRKESFTFLGAKSQFCKNKLFGKNFCNKQLCSKCVSENAPTIDWDEDSTIEKRKPSYDESVQKIIEVTLHRSVLQNSPQITKTQPCFSGGKLLGGCSNFQLPDNHSPENVRDHYSSSRFSEDDDALFHPIVECDDERENGFNHKSASESPLWAPLPNRKSSKFTRKGNSPLSADEIAVVSSCSLEVSELLANMPPLGLSNNNSPSNDMDTLDGLSNLDSETENQSLLNYSSSMRLHRDLSFSRDDKKSAGDGCLQTTENSGQFLNVGLTDRSDKLSERSSLLSCTFSFDDGDKSSHSNQFALKDPLLVPTFRTNNNNNNVNKSDSSSKSKSKSNGKIHPPIPLPSTMNSDKDSDDEMVRLLNDITVLADHSGVFRNLKYFLRGFYKTEIEEPSEDSNLLPKETYFGPGSPKSLKRNGPDSHKAGGNGDSDVFNHKQLPRDDDSFSSEIIQSFGNRWAYTYDEDDGVISDTTDRSSSFGNYCMGEPSESQIIDLSQPLQRRHIDSTVKDGFSRALIGLDDSYSDNNDNYDAIAPVKANPMVAGYGSARKETKV